jgi:hypothetical protein
MNLIDKVKSLLLGGALALSRAEKDVLQEIINKGGNDIRAEEKIQQQEIKIISEKKFYQLLEGADKYMNKRDEFKLQSMLKARGLENVEHIFTNRELGNLYDLHPDASKTDFTFKTDNGLFKCAENLHVSDINGSKELKFFINTKLHPAAGVNWDQLTDLTYFEIIDDYLKYSYNVHNFIGSVRDNHYLILKFQAQVYENGISVVGDDNEMDRKMTKDDLINEQLRNAHYTDYLNNQNNYPSA